MKDLVAKDVMSREVLTVPPDLTVHELSTFLVENQISGAPVADAQGRFLGLASLTDIAESDAMRDESPDVAGHRARRRRASTDEEDLAGLSVRTADLLVRDIMTPAVFAVAEDTPVRQIAQTMIAGRIHRLLVKRGQRVVGIVTSLDLLRQLAETTEGATTRPSLQAHGLSVLGLLLAGLIATGCSRAASMDTAPAAGLAPPASVLPAGHPTVGPMPQGQSIRGSITLAPRLRGQAPEGAALFLIARAGTGGPIVAVRKDDDVTFPHSFELSGSDAMTHGESFGGVLDVTARLSRTGDAAPAPGDIEGHAAGVAAGSRDVQVTLDTVRTVRLSLEGKGESC